MNFNDLIAKFSNTAENQQKAIFSTLFIAGNKLQTLFDKHIPEISLKQFMLLSIVRQSEKQLTFTQLGTLLGCSRQNIKKLAYSNSEFVDSEPEKKEEKVIHSEKKKKNKTLSLDETEKESPFMLYTYIHIFT